MYYSTPVCNERATKLIVTPIFLLVVSYNSQKVIDRVQAVIKGDKKSKYKTIKEKHKESKRGGRRDRERVEGKKGHSNN